MIALGILLLILGLVIHGLGVLVTLGIILILVGIVLNFVPIGGSTRRWY